MIKYIKVNGFRTLSDFEMEIRPGLNLLVGPNGGGKSTLMMFFSFIFDVYSNNLSTAVSNIGGAGNIFRKVAANEYERLISGEIFGELSLTDIELTAIPPSEKKRLNKFGAYAYYKYKFEIELTEDREDVYFKLQEFSVKQTHNLIKSPNRITKWELRFVRDFNDIDTKCFGLDDRESVEKYNFRTFRIKKTDPKKEYRVLEDFTKNDDSLIHVVRFFEGLIKSAVVQDFGRRILYNPQPDQIRKSEDSAKSPGIRPDGSGLYASLLSLKRRKSATRLLNSIYTSPYPFRHYINFSKLIEYYKFAFPALHSLEVINDPFDNQIRARVTLDSKDGIQLPLAALSDGTLKWMSLATALLTTRAVTGIEEPENFIHPAVQQQAIELIRSNTNKNSFVLVSTHSQSILDAALPEEVVFITLKKSKTSVHRVKCPEKIKNLIYESGFNLSFYYLSGALEDA